MRRGGTARGVVSVWGRGVWAGGAALLRLGTAPLRGALGLGVWSVGFASLNPRLLTGIALRCGVGWCRWRARVLVWWVQTLARLATDARRAGAGRRWSHGRRRTKGHAGRPRSGAWWHGELEAGCGVVPLTGSHTNCRRCASRAASVCRTGWCAHLCQGVPDFLNHTH